MTDSHRFKSIVVGDPHLTHKSYDKISQLFDIIEERPEDVVIWLGDFLDTKEIIRGRCLNLLNKMFTESKKQHIILIGNHDYFNLDCEEHSMEVFKIFHPQVIIVDKVMKSNGMWFVPYFHDMDKLKEALNVIPNDAAVFGHFDTVGFDYGNGYISDGGLRPNDFKRFKRVVSGHYHKYQEKGNLVYLGTPFSHSFGESGQNKFIGVYHSRTDKLDLIPTPFERHETWEVDCDKSIDAPLLNSKNLHRVILKGEKENIAKFNREGLPPGTKIVERPMIVSNDIIIEETHDNLKQFETWSKEVKELDTETISLGVEILENNR